MIATLPPGQSNWLERGLIEKARARFDVPVTHLVSSEAPVEQPSRREPPADGARGPSGSAEPPATARTADPADCPPAAGASPT